MPSDRSAWRWDARRRHRRSSPTLGRCARAGRRDASATSPARSKGWTCGLPSSSTGRRWSRVWRARCGSPSRSAHPQVGVLFDPAHWYTTPTKFEDIDQRAVRHIFHVHMDDMRDKPADLSDCNSDRVLPGQGVIDLERMIATLEGYGYTGYFSIEMFNDDLWALPAADAARQCYESLVPFCK